MCLVLTVVTAVASKGTQLRFAGRGRKRCVSAVC